MKPEFEIEINDLSHDGRGVGRLESGKTVFVTGALPGERVRARQTRKKRSFEEARTLEVLRASPLRIEPRCPHYGSCGGCVLQHLDPAEQIVAKQRVLMENFERIGHVRPERVLDPLAGPHWGYRRKARLGVKWVAQKGRAVVGFREQDARFIAELSRCEVVVPRLGECIDALAAVISGMDARDRIPQVELAAGDEAAVLVVRHLVPLSDGDREALAAFGRAHGFAILLQPGGPDSLEALDGPAPQLRFALPEWEVDFDFEPLDFVQVNAEINQRMVAHAIALLDPQPTERVLDLFCGLGNFSLPLARRAREVVGVEGDAGLVARARANAARNGIASAAFHAADLTTDLRGEPWFGAGFDKLLLDPPRSGAEAVIAQLPLAGIGRIVYVSCHPGSLARDAGALVREHGFRLVAAGVMDMFPHTAHVESIALFER